MIKGIGVDITELDRMETLINRQPRLKERILTESEILIFEKLNGRRKVEYFAGRFAAKEAFSKANGTGIGKHLSFLDIEIISDDKGKPVISKPFSKGVHLSISHSRDYAVAQVVIEG
ncbi:holo-ACP synthase [Peribacillus castrilensis]|uniref:Holo-[acyl-carrier-protein] synthase n=1 Tax=Peribacillus frigoritolerans TaxID=450367 RepID=A0AAJ1QJ39_9BACI|nr:holo-ACP synthase [Peribacillus frigoritolerans]KRF54069.1 4'-phosphopantetheinyl transferase [Bacillus sp. Soil745]MCD1163746.1 holo-ACP synthase [Peribacillus castrilensis]PAW26422.1 holo-ACP synthase [Peribacillus simplex]MCU6604047.1 holo-ACP synthase [Peribacillus frigoritolerans]MCY9005621.1 holo-ACP synthase [Peribacillus frigoritolerans]